jgi:hypothetical protein
LTFLITIFVIGNTNWQALVIASAGASVNIHLTNSVTECYEASFCKILVIWALIFFCWVL